ncbi:hypothetical protein NE634_08280 [Lacrimispora saccharolytica]|nr:hypothetical protein [Lacrimispora saccharolytica]
MATNTIFDDVFRTMQEKMPEQTIPLINAVFGTQYPIDTEIIQGRNEHHTENGEVITDSYLVIDGKRYHIECQSTEDQTMVLRMIEYDFAIGLENARKVDGIYRIQLPHPCILYLRGENQDTLLSMELVLFDGQIIKYQVPVIRMEWYSLNEIFEKNLVILLPFYMMRYEKMKEQVETDSELRERIFQECRAIEQYLEKGFLKKGMEKEFRDMTELVNRIGDYIFLKQQKVRKGLGEIMGGKVLELESDKLIKKGEQIGKQIGEKAVTELTKKLLAENRLDDLKRSVEDPAYQRKLLQEMENTK